MTTMDEWLTSAMSDDRMVAELLLHLNPSSSSAPTLPDTSFLPPTRWGFRQTRSRMAFNCDISPEKKQDSARNSPTTPLAWSTGGSAAASSSGTADGSDESTLPVFRSSDSRSKFVIADEPATADAKKRKKKKTFAELKEEEVSLLKERVHLKKEIATLRTTFEEHSATNENLKRMKLDFDLNSTNGATIAADEKEETASAFDSIYRTYPTSQNASNFCQASIPLEETDGGFLLPDLNMTPYEDDFSSDGLHGVSCAEEIQVTGC